MLAPDGLDTGAEVPAAGGTTSGEGDVAAGKGSA